MAAIDILLGILLFPLTLGLGSPDFRVRHQTEQLLVKVGPPIYGAAVLGEMFAASPEHGRRCENLVERLGDFPGVHGAAEKAGVLRAARLLCDCPAFQQWGEATEYFGASPRRLRILVDAVRAKTDSDCWWRPRWEQNLRKLASSGFPAAHTCAAAGDTVELAIDGHPNYLPGWYR